MLLIGLAVAAIAGLVGGIIAKRAMHPLATLTKSVETVAVTQDLSTRVGNNSIGWFKMLPMNSPDNAAVRVEIDGHMVSVSDEGPGIPEAERKKIFERFYRSDTARAEPGSGLGLAIVEKIVTDHGGRTFMDASPTGGARVVFELPNRSSSE